MRKGRNPRALAIWLRLFALSTSLVVLQNQGVMVGMMGYSTYYYGFEVIAKRGVLSVEHPTKDGKVAMWDLEGGMWRYVLAAVLDVEPSEASVLAVTPVDASEEYIERTMVAFALIHFPHRVNEHLIYFRLV